MVSPAGLPGLSASAALPWWQRRVLRCNRSGAAALLLLLALSGLLLNATLPFWLGMGGVEALHRQLVELEGRGSPAELQAAFHAALQAAGSAPSAGGAAFGSRLDGRSAPRANAPYCTCSPLKFTFNANKPMRWICRKCQSHSCTCVVTPLLLGRARC